MPAASFMSHVPTPRLRCELLTYNSCTHTTWGRGTYATKLTSRSAGAATPSPPGCFRFSGRGRGPGEDSPPPSGIKFCKEFFCRASHLRDFLGSTPPSALRLPGLGAAAEGARLVAPAVPGPSCSTATSAVAPPWCGDSPASVREALADPWRSVAVWCCPSRGAGGARCACSGPLPPASALPPAAGCAAAGAAVPR